MSSAVMTVMVEGDLVSSIGVLVGVMTHIMSSGQSFAGASAGGRQPAACFLDAPSAASAREAEAKSAQTSAKMRPRFRGLRRSFVSVRPP